MKALLKKHPDLFMDAIEGALSDAEDVAKVTELPETGETGKFYYNETDGKYYVYDETDGFKPIGESEGIALVDDGFTSQEDGGYDVDIQPNVFYDFGNVDNSLTLNLTGGEEGFVSEYMGRFTANLTEYTPEGGSATTPESFTLDIDPEPARPDNNPDIEDGHAYEFNIMAGVLVLSDITQTEEGD